MVYLAGLVVLLSVAGVEARVGNSTESSFCTETKECLLFDLVCKTSDFEVRHYSSVRWVSTDVTSHLLDIAQVTGFLRLYKYINGANVDGVKIDMTAPIIVKVEEDDSFWESTVFTINFLLPSAFQGNVSEPTDSTVYFTDMPDMKVYVRDYGGLMISITDALNRKWLAKNLKKVNASYVEEFHYAVKYDSPTQILNRRNEVWYVVKGDPVCSDPDGTQNGAR
ncbi:heme-binding protein 2 isoform X2 [Paramormyrops kingsleyae]|uniref:Heme-binding protein 1 n=1 Tax=Paramormyrops kingsleyae TaxID=1676925 RepID=A0A3B3T0H9_9TELE|nr:heme-binding protein 2-like isoform X2 [Paramormyrops kingsleyae]